MAMLVKHRFDGNALDTYGSLHGTVTSTTFETSELHQQGKEAVFNGTTSKIVSGLQMSSQTAAIFSAWIKPVSGNGYIMGQHNGSTQGVGLELNCDRTTIDASYPENKILCHFNTSFEDSSIYKHVAVPNATALPTISATQSKFGTKSLSCQTALSYLYIPTIGTSGVLGTGNFTIDMWVYRTVAGVQHYLYDQRPSATNGVYPSLYIATNNTLRYLVSAVDRIAGATTVPADTWFHVAVVRNNGTTTMYLDGVVQGTAYTDANSYINGANRPVIGADGGTITLGVFTGYIDELRVRSGATWTAAFTPPTVPYADWGVVEARIRGTLNGLATGWYPIPKDRHTPVTLSYDTGVLSLYIGGELKETVSATVTWPATPFTFGCLNAGTNFTACRIAAFAAWDTAASATAALYLSWPTNLNQITDITCPPTTEETFATDTTAGKGTWYTSAGTPSVAWDAGNLAMNLLATSGGNVNNHYVLTSFTPYKQFTFEVEMQMYTDTANRDHCGLEVALGPSSASYLPYMRVSWVDRLVAVPAFFSTVSAAVSPPSALLHAGTIFVDSVIRTLRVTWDFFQRHMVFYVDGIRVYELLVPGDQISWIHTADGLAGQLPIIHAYNANLKVYQWKYWNYIIPGAPFGCAIVDRCRYPGRPTLISPFVEPFKGYHPYGNSHANIVSDGWASKTVTNHPKGNLAGNLNEQYDVTLAGTPDGPNRIGAVSWLDQVDGAGAKYSTGDGAQPNPTKFGKIQGFIYEDGGTPISRRVVCLSHEDGRIVRETWSKADGSYLFQDLHMDRLFTLMAYDYEGVYNAVVADRVSPEIYPL